MIFMRINKKYGHNHSQKLHQGKGGWVQVYPLKV